MKLKIFVENTLFLGRIQEQKQFRVALQELLNQSTEEDLPYVMLIYGDGGMGKTTLAKRLRDIALLEQPFQGEFQVLWVDWEDERTRNIGLNVDHRHITPEVVFEVIHSAIIRNKLGAFFTNYQATVKQLAQAEKQVVQALTTNNQYDDLIQLKGLGAGALASLVRSGVPAIGQTGEKLVETFLNVGIRVSVEQATRIRVMLEQRLRAVLSPEQYEVFLNHQEQLAMALAHGVNKLSEKKPTVIFLDTYEIIDQVDVWMRLLISFWCKTFKTREKIGLRSGSAPSS